MDFKTIIKNLRESRSLTQKELALELTSLSNSKNKIYAQTVSYWENGREPSIPMLILLSKYFDVSIDYLVGNTSVKKPPTHSFFTDDDINKINNSNLKDSLKPSTIESFTSLIENLIYVYIDLITHHEPNYQIISSYRNCIKSLTSYFMSISSDTSMLNEYVKSELLNCSNKIDSLCSFKHELKKCIINGERFNNPIERLNSANEYYRLFDHLDFLKSHMVENSINHALFSLLSLEDSDIEHIKPFIIKYLKDTEYVDSII